MKRNKKTFSFTVVARRVTTETTEYVVEAATMWDAEAIVNARILEAEPEEEDMDVHVDLGGWHAYETVLNSNLAVELE